MKEVLDFLQSNKVFFMATVDGDTPKVRPLGFVMEYDGKIYFGVGEQKEVYRQMKANPKVEICSVSQEGRWLRLSGAAKFDPRPELNTAAVKALPVLAEMYPAGGPKLGIFHLQPATAVFHDLNGNTKTVEL